MTGLRATGLSLSLGRRRVLDGIDLAFSRGRVTALLGPPPELAFGDEEQRALDVLAAGGLVPPLRLVQAERGPDIESA